MKLGTSIRFLYPTGPHTYPQFKQVFDSLPPGAFFERPMGAEDTVEQARNVLELAAVLRPLLDGETVSFEGQFVQLDNVTISPMPRVPVETWIGETVPVVADL